ncbi:AraC family transcriptional regulator [Rhodopseudomonas sp. B29]|uniref:AraC family transcriptional regulator n=1 Tax=Rhodopseudomonas sp. B29 TaxID=95607 RepID=UPI0004CE6619|nr:AraC family transcriptional regulator [Rhodopseudomonas sp. B29]
MYPDSVKATFSPLRGFEHVRTSNVAELEDQVRRHYRDVTFGMAASADKLDALACRCEIRDVTLTYGRHGAKIEIGIPELDVYSLLFGWKGHAHASRSRSEIAITPHSAFVASAGEPVRLRYESNFEQLILSVRPSALVSKLEAMLDDSPTHRLTFSPAADFRRPAVENLRRQFVFLLHEIDSSESAFHPVALAEFEQTLLVSFLLANDNNYSVKLNRRAPAAAPWQVRRIESYIEANWDQPMTIESLALVAGVSARAVFHAFRKSRGYSPMDFAKRVRLGKARDMLLRPQQSTSVTSVALTCGFNNLGHFAIYYQKAFGEPPSTTLRGARA